MNHQPTGPHTRLARPSPVAHTPWRATPIPGGPYSPTAIVLLAPRAAFAYLAAMNTLYLMSYMIAGAFPPPPTTILDNVATPDAAVLGTIGQVFVGIRDFAGHWAFFGVTPTPLAAIAITIFSLATGQALAHISRPPRHIIEKLIKAPDSDSADDQHDAQERARQSRARRVAGVHAALAQLDAEWLAYTLDTTAYYLTKPVLRDRDTQQTAAYQHALYELRERADGLNDQSSDNQIAAAEAAADTALHAWAAADDHALTVGVSDRSPTERAALRRLHALVGQLSDPSTPRPMRSTILEKIRTEMDKLTTVPTSWEHLATLPALEGLNLAAIAPASKRRSPSATAPRAVPPRAATPTIAEE